MAAISKSFGRVPALVDADLEGAPGGGGCPGRGARRGSQSAPPPSSLLTMAAISKSFGRVRALVDADLEVAQGEVHGLVGGNGAGKTKLMDGVCGRHRP